MEVIVNEPLCKLYPVSIRVLQMSVCSVSNNEFALTGTLTKFDTTAAKGGGLDAHIWWVGSGKPSANTVTVSFTDDKGDAFTVTRSRANGCDTTPEEIMGRSIQKAINRVQGIYDRYPDLAYSGDRIHQGLHQ